MPCRSRSVFALLLDPPFLSQRATSTDRHKRPSIALHRPTISYESQDRFPVRSLSPRPTSVVLLQRSERRDMTALGSDIAIKFANKRG